MDNIKQSSSQQSIKNAAEVTSKTGNADKAFQKKVICFRISRVGSRGDGWSYCQISKTKRYSFRAALRFVLKTYQQTGFLSLFRGNSATMARVIPFASIQFASHEQYKHLLNVDKNGNHTPVKRFLIGSLAATTATIFTYPLDTAKARLSVSSYNDYRNLRDVFLKDYQKYGLTGLRNLYSGLRPTILGAMANAGASFFTYDTCKIIYVEETGRPINPLNTMVFGALAGIVGQTTSYPLDIIRRRMQTNRIPPNHGLLLALNEVRLNEGFVNGLYKGLSMNWLKGPIAVGISFTVYDHLFLCLKFFMEEK